MFLRLRIFILGICALTSCGPLFAQHPESRFSRLTIEDGLSQSVVNCIIQDRDGYLWLGTEDGLNRYDGRSFTVHRHSFNKPTSLSNSFVWAVFEDRKGVLWVGTDYGLNRFDRAAGKFIHYLSDPNNPETLSGNIIRHIYEDREGALWIGTAGDGVNRMDPVTGKCVRYRNDPNDPASLGGRSVADVYEDLAGDLWVASPPNGGLNRLDRTTGRWIRYQHDPNDPTSLGNNWVRTVCEDNRGRLWVGTHDGGLNLLDRATGRFTRFQNDPADPNSLSHNDVQTLYVDRAGVLWVGTYNGGLNRMDPVTGKFTRFQHNPNRSDGLSNNSIRSIYEDRSGVLWVGTAGGLNQLDQRPKRFIAYRHDPANPFGLNRNSVKALHAGRDGMVWVGTADGGLSRFDPATGAFASYRHDPNDPTSLGADWVSDICEGRDGSLWVGTRTGGLNRMNRKSGRFTRFLHDPKNPDSISLNNVSALYEDRDGMLWIGTVGGDLNRLDPSTGIFTHYVYKENDPATISNSTVWMILQDRNGMLWLGTYKGLSRMDPVTGRCTRYSHDPNNPTSLSHDNISCLHEDRNGTLWIGTYGGGLNRMDRETGVFTVFTMRDGLPNDAVQGILEDRNGYLWLSTNQGLCKFDTVAGACQNYDSSDGLQSNEFSAGTCCRTPQGEMYFGGTGGFTRFLPESVRENNRFVPPVVVTSFSKFGKKVEAFDGKEIEPLAYDENFIGFEFAALNYIQPQKNRYAFRLQGVDKDWIYCGTQTWAVYTDLRPGEYVFQVKGSNNDEIWNEEGVSLRVRVLPPPWLTWWAYALYVAAAAGLLLAAFRVQAQRVRAQAKLQLAHSQAATAEAERLAIAAKAEAALAEKEAAQARAELAEIGAEVAGELARKNMELENKNDALERKNRELVAAQQQADRIFSALAEALPGSVLDGKYRLDEKLGEGGFGAVFKATHLMLNRPIAVKVFRPTPGNDSAESVERFKREGISASKLRHPNIIQMMDSGISSEGIAYLVMELLVGRTLADELHQERRLTVLRCRQIVTPICEALVEAHRQNIIHRDIKPENIFLHRTEEGETVKVVDFGIAKMLGDENDEHAALTAAGLIVGTPVYMAPERLVGDSYDERSDVYSVGVVLYEMLSGYTPHHSSGKRVWEIVGNMMKSPPVPLRQRNPYVPPDVEEVVMRALAKRPSDRPTMAEFAAEWAEVADRHVLRVNEAPTWESEGPLIGSTLAFVPTDFDGGIHSSDATESYAAEGVDETNENARTLVQPPEASRITRDGAESKPFRLPTEFIQTAVASDGFEPPDTVESRVSSGADD